MAPFEKIKRLYYVYLSALMISFNTLGSEFHLKVVDVGSGLCIVAKNTEGFTMLYDTGHWIGNHCYTGIKEYIDSDVINLLVLSHMDADHIGNTSQILSDYEVKTIIHTGYKRPRRKVWRKTMSAISEQSKHGASVISLATSSMKKGHTFHLGSTKVKFLLGSHSWSQNNLSEPEKRNALSIVMQIQHNDKSILLTGDMVGRNINSTDETCIASEKLLIDTYLLEEITSDIIIAPHHGANNASSNCLLRSVSPTYALFSAGHRHSHPRRNTIKRYMDFGVSPYNIFRTDRGDDEGIKESKLERIINCIDGPGDDDILISINNAKKIKVAYVNPNNTCTKYKQ